MSETTDMSDTASPITDANLRDLRKMLDAANAERAKTCYFGQSAGISCPNPVEYVVNVEGNPNPLYCCADDLEYAKTTNRKLNLSYTVKKIEDL